MTHDTSQRTLDEFDRHRAASGAHSPRERMTPRSPRTARSLSVSSFIRRRSNPFPVQIDQLCKLSDEHDGGKALEEMGGINIVAGILGTDLDRGIQSETVSEDVELRKRVFGENKVPEPTRKNYFQLLLETFKDMTLIILCIAATLSLGLSFVDVSAASPCDDFDPHNELVDDEEENDAEFLEAIAILVAVVIVSNVTAANDYSKEKQFRKLNEASRNTDNIQVVRAGKRVDIQTQDLVVGDILMLTAGDKIPSDGLVVKSQGFTCDESSLTGEPDLQKKPPSSYMKAGAIVAEGYGQMLVTAVGVSTDSGKAQMLLRADTPDPTPLQHKLDKMAKDIGKIGMGFAVVTLVSVIIRFFVCRAEADGKWEWEELKVLLNYLILAVTIVVVAVPEGLPLAVTISLAYSMKKMMADQNLVRKLAACETMGGATNICSDKTGTLTENRMAVTEGIVFGEVRKPIPHKDTLTNVPETPITMLLEALAINTQDASYVQLTEQNVWDFKGNKTECALLVMCQELGGNFSDIREGLVNAGSRVRSIAFTSDRKRMTTLVKAGDSAVRVHTKGAGEIVLRLCTHCINEHGNVVELTPSLRTTMEEHITRLTKAGLRTLCVAYREQDCPKDTDMTTYVEQLSADELERDLTMLCLVGIKDPVRAAVPAAVAACKRAGITVRMVTGDNIETAKHIARECGILDNDGIVMDGQQFRSLSHEEVLRILPRLQVLARSKPIDKHTLVKKLRDQGEVVAVTGDGTNDAPALKEADVGLAMGITGTDVAKKASDIVILDDNFASIVRAVLWGRNVYDSIRKFLQFQLTVNVAALFIAFIGSIANSRTPLTPVQLLWVNLIMDTLAALALATEPPSQSLLDRKPYGRFDPLVSPRMWINIIGQSLLQITILLIMLFAGEDMYVSRADDDPEKKEDINYTMIFNAFVYLQLFNEINARRLDDQINVFAGFFTNSLFVGVILTTIVIQAIIVEFGKDFFQVEPLNLEEFLITLAIATTTWPWQVLLKQIKVDGGTVSLQGRKVWGRQLEKHESTERLGLEMSAAP